MYSIGSLVVNFACEYQSDFSTLKDAALHHSSSAALYMQTVDLAGQCC